MYWEGTRNLLKINIRFAWLNIELDCAYLWKRSELLIILQRNNIPVCMYIYVTVYTNQNVPTLKIVLQLSGTSSLYTEVSYRDFK